MKVELTKKCSNKTHAFTQTAIGAKNQEKYVRFSYIQSSTKIRKTYLDRLFGDIMDSYGM